MQILSIVNKFREFSATPDKANFPGEDSPDPH